jgi:predicted DNA-binding transcriptional regulator YafY
VKKEARLSTILFLLKANKSQRADELAEALKVNVRTIYRDIEALMAAGLPIRGTQGPSGGYVLAEHFPVDPLVYASNDGLSLISTSDGKATSGENPDVGQAMDTAVRLWAESLPEHSRALVQRVRQRFLFDTSNWLWRDAMPYQFPELKEAILKDRVVDIIYTERGITAVQSDTVDPYGMVWRQGHWYLVAFSHTRRRMERHRLQRIVSVRPTEKEFTRSPSFSLISCWQTLLENFGKGRTRIRVKIEFPATLDFESFGWKKDQQITKHSDHWIVDMPLDHYEWLIPLVLSYGDKVEVLEPPSVREEIADKLKAMIIKYTDCRNPAANR